ncbi:hypothetical protein ELI24_08610 [Rhizobium ruizarguesonis]|uniref:hypothetical protein n=1 Tax=Rhizobium ruizarguesonis TaxID=2081791 RepID=UPI00102F77AB|nr:hypothetical protein [Rhizobium ruizarguesonis]TAV98442.1 hypothetical protein ELI24_08610 [Rhizobium ruizarguesonis]
MATLLYAGLSTRALAQVTGDGVVVGAANKEEANSILETAARLGLLPDEPRPAGPVSAFELADIIKAAVQNEKRNGSGVLARRAGLLLSELTTQGRESRNEDISEPQPAKPHPFKDMREYYTNLANSVELDPVRASELRKISEKIIASKQYYSDVAKISGIPWYVVGSLHYREASLNFMGHLHNGDPLLMKTVHVPADRPQIAPWPPRRSSLRQIWQISAVDALGELRAKTSKWTIERTCWALEGYNGYGCFDHGINTPYLWNYTNKYSGGGYASDGHYSESYKSKQAGLYSLLLALSEMDEAIKKTFMLES